MKNVLHIYGQSMWHDDILIIGDEAALSTLRDAITHALNTGKSGRAYTFANDGEGYGVQVVRTDREHALGAPYTDECARERRPMKVWPWLDNPPDPETRRETSGADRRG